MTDAAKELGISLSAICKAVKMNRPVRGFKFYRKSVWDKITQKKMLNNKNIIAKINNDAL